MSFKNEKAASFQTVETTSASASHTYLGADVGVSRSTAELKDRGTPQRVLQWYARKSIIARARPPRPSSDFSPPCNSMAPHPNATLHLHLRAGKLARAAG